jgi:hypothetical protein
VGVTVPDDRSEKRTSKFESGKANSWQKSGVITLPARSVTPILAVNEGVIFTKAVKTSVHEPWAVGLRAVRRISFVPPEAKAKVECCDVDVRSKADPTASS